MIRNLLAIAASLAALAFSPATGPAQPLPGSCWSCNYAETACDQFCDVGGIGTQCRVFRVENCWICNTYGEACSGDFVLTPIQLSPAGTFISARTVMRPGGYSVSRCGGYIVAHRTPRTYASQFARAVWRRPSPAEWGEAPAQVIRI